MTCQRALHCFLRLQRVDVGKAGHPRDFLVEARIVLHRARAEREQAKVDGVILPRQARIVAHGFRLGQAGRPIGAVRVEAAEAVGTTFGIGRCRRRSCWSIADLEDQCFFEHQRAVAGERRRRCDASHRSHLGLPSACFMLMPAPPSSAVAKRFDIVGTRGFGHSDDKSVVRARHCQDKAAPAKRRPGCRLAASSWTTVRASRWQSAG